MRISQRLFIRFWTCIYDYIPCFMRSMSILVCLSLTPDVIGTTTGVWRHVAHSRVIVLCGSEGEWCTQRICGSTWWWRAPKRLFSAGWSHILHLEWEHDRNRKLFWWPDYFESLMAAIISWLTYMHVQNLMNSLWDIGIFLGLVPKESPCITKQAKTHL